MHQHGLAFQSTLWNLKLFWIPKFLLYCLIMTVVILWQTTLFIGFLFPSSHVNTLEVSVSAKYFVIDVFQTNVMAPRDLVYYEASLHRNVKTQCDRLYPTDWPENITTWFVFNPIILWSNFKEPFAAITVPKLPFCYK